MENHLACLLCDKAKRVHCRQLHVLFGIIKERHQRNQRYIYKLLGTTLRQTHQKQSKGTNAALTIAPILVFNSIFGKSEDLLLKIDGIPFKDSLECASGRFANAITLLLTLFNKTKIVQQPLDQPFSKRSLDILVHIGIRLDALLLLGKSGPKLHGQCTGNFFSCVTQNRIDKFGKALNVVLPHKAKT